MSSQEQINEHQETDASAMSSQEQINEQQETDTFAMNSQKQINERQETGASAESSQKQINEQHETDTYAMSSQKQINEQQETDASAESSPKLINEHQETDTAAVSSPKQINDLNEQSGQVTNRNIQPNHKSKHMPLHVTDKFAQPKQMKTERPSIQNTVTIRHKNKGLVTKRKNMINANKAVIDMTSKTSKAHKIKTISQKNKLVSKFNIRHRLANTSKKQKLAVTTNKEFNTSFMHERKMRKRKATNIQSRQRPAKLPKLNDNEESSSDDDKPLIFFKKSIQEETDVDMDPTYKPNINDVNSSDSEYSDNMSEKEKASSKEKETLKNLMEKSLKKLAKTSSQTNNVNEHFKKKSVKAKQLGTQSRISHKLEKCSTVSMSNCHRKLSYKQCQEAKGPCISTENYSNVNAEETRQGLPVKENYMSLIVRAKQESQQEAELRQMMDQVHEQRLDQLLFSNGYIRQYAPSDGNCFFEAAVFAMSSDLDSTGLRKQLCMHLEDNMEEYVGFLMSKTRDIDDLAFIKSYCKEIEVLKQNGYWSTKAGDFLPLALANWSKRPVRIYTSNANLHK